jgi:hypothetical protein
MSAVGDDIRDFVRELEKLVDENRAASIIGPIIHNAKDHLLLRAFYSEKINVTAEETP